MRSCGSPSPNWPRRGLRYGQTVGATDATEAPWINETPAEGQSDTGWAPHLVWSPTAVSIIADEFSGPLQLARRSQAGWQVDDLCEDCEAGSLAVDAVGGLHLVYADNRWPGTTGLVYAPGLSP